MQTLLRLDASRRTPSAGAVLAALIALLATALLAIDHRDAQAATRAVTIHDYAFDPTTVKVNVGDTVKWTNKESDGAAHNIDFDDGSGSQDIPHNGSYSRTFSRAGSYHYICSLHSYMEGTVTVGGGGSGGSPSNPPKSSPTPTPTSTGPLPALPPAPELPPLPLQDGKARDLGDGTQLAPYKYVDGVKVFSLRMMRKKWEVTPGRFREAWTFNGIVPGPVLRVTEGDRVRFIVRNDLPEETAVHWHGMELPNDQDGVPGVTQKAIPPAGTFTYEWTAITTGSHWYHSHMGGNQIGRGLFGSLEVVPLAGDIPSDRDYRLMVADGALGMTLNGKSFPATRKLVARVGERIRIRLIGAGPEGVHPIHIHGQPFDVVAQDGMALPVPTKMDTLTVAVGQTFDLVVVPRRPGKWLVHCHIFSHSETAHGMTGLVTMLDVAPLVPDVTASP